MTGMIDRVRPKTPTRRALVALLATAFAVFPTTSMTDTADARTTYDIVACNFNGTPAPTDGWSATTQGVGAVVYNSCDTKGRFGGALDRSTMPLGSAALWTFDAPPGTRIHHYSIFRFAASHRSGGWMKGYGLYHNVFAADGSDAVDHCFATTGCATLGKTYDWFGM